MLAISPLNPVRFTTLDEIRFLTKGDCLYKQKWQKGDEIRLQLLKDSPEPIPVKIQDCNTGKIVLSLLSTPVDSNILVDNFNVHLLNVFLEDLPTFGNFRFIIEDSLSSFPFEYREYQENTILITYTNSVNDFNVIFDIGYQPYLRLEGSLSNFQPRLDSTVYNDQIKNPTLLSGMPYRNYTLFLGNGRGVPDWMIDLANMILACDTKRVDDLNFEITDGSELEIQRVDNYPLVAASIEVAEKENVTADIWFVDPVDIVLSARHENGGEKGFIKLDANGIPVSKSITARGNIGLYVFGDPPETPPWMLIPFSITLSGGQTQIEIPLTDFHADDTAAIPRFHDVEFIPNSVDRRENVIIGDVQLYVPIEVYLDGHAVEFEFSMAVTTGIASALAENVKVVGNVVAYFDGEIYAKYPFSITIEAGNTDANIGVPMDVFSENYYVFEDLTVVPVEIGGNPLVITGKTIVIEN